jgi:diguanylate cyclase (GGDEF)-like protein
VVRSSPAIPRQLLRSLRLQVTVALAVAAAACAIVASKSSSDELHGAYRDSARAILGVASNAFERSHETAALGSPVLSRAELRELLDQHPELESVSIYRAGGGSTLVSAGQQAGGRTEGDMALEAMSSGERTSAELRDDGRHAEALVTPLREEGRVVGALAVTYDLRPAHQLLGERNERVALVLGILLLSFTVFTAVVLRRGIFRPLDRLRLATQAVGAGDLATRLGWRRQDELGQLSREFDAMAVELEENNQRLEELAHRDPLTGLANHRRFQEVLSKELSHARRDGRPVAVVILDIDEFKRINDSRGHPFGDELLFGAAASLRSAMRGIGVVARVGGDEFGLVIPDADGSRALALAEAARTAVEAAAPMRGSLHCSAGIACFPDDARNAGALLQLADGALSWAKDTGRGRSRRYDPEHVFVVTEEQREDFSQLIARPAAVQPVFQPIVSLASGEAVGFEALARFEGKPALPPSWWFSQAHRFGLGAALEAEAVRAALAAVDRPPGCFISVNLSPSALASPETGEQLPEDLDGVVIEITEEERVLDVGALQRHLDPLRSRGARIAVDDAGEGYAGLQQVMSMRADIIKLDRALVADVHADPAKIALIGSLVHFARSTGAVICAEGVETLDELRVLIHLGVAHGQGWALGRPGAAWPRVNPEAARVCREMRSEQAKVVPLGSKLRGAGSG